MRITSNYLDLEPNLYRFNMLQSAGILAYRKTQGQLEFFLVHPGGPFFAKKEDGIYTIPKGLIEEKEEPLATAIREFEEETGVKIWGDFLSLGSITQKGGKVVQAWAVEFDIDPDKIKSNTFSLEWPPKSGRMQDFPEIDKAGWFELKEAKKLINEKQQDFLFRLMENSN
jgi:predicted NUDIX family NTP pyrophosphohydrolase